MSNNIVKVIKEANHKKHKEWLIDKLENTELDVDELEAAFVKKFGKSAKKYYQKHLADLM